MGRRRRKGLSERHKRILEVLKDYRDNVGYPPSIREICDKASISSTSVVNYYLDQLQEMGYIERDGRVSQGIRLIKPLDQIVSEGSLSIAGAANSVSDTIRQSAQNLHQTVEDLLQIPVLGRIVAGSPAPVPSTDFSYFDAESMVTVASSLLPGRDAGSDLYALEVQGESMIDAMVSDGDIVIMKPAQEAQDGEMVAVWLNDRDETTLKYLYRENGKVRLQPANPSMKPIYINDPGTVEIQGKVVMVIRQVKGMAS